MVDRFIQVEAKLTPAASVAKVRLLFRGADAADWYFVVMTAAAGSDTYQGHIPKPQEKLKAFDYYIEVNTHAFEEARTPETRVDVIPAQKTCSRGALAQSVGGLATRLVVSSLGGGAALPSGFASSGVVAAAGSGSAAAASSAAGAAGGGGLSAGLLLAGAGVAGGAAAVAAKSSDEKPAAAPPPTPTPSTIYDIAFQPSPPGLDVSVCAGVPTTFSGVAGIQVTSGGTFDTVASQNTPVLRVVGSVTATTFQATLTCTNGAQSGSLSATGANNSYSGSFTFGNQRGQCTVTKR